MEEAAALTDGSGLASDAHTRTDATGQSEKAMEESHVLPATKVSHKNGGGCDFFIEKTKESWKLAVKEWTGLHSKVGQENMARP